MTRPEKGSTMSLRHLARAALIVAAAALITTTALNVGPPGASAATAGDLVSLAHDNLGKHYCSTNSKGGVGFETSCNGEFWCADFVKWVWDKSSIDITGLDPWAGHFGGYGTVQSTPHIGDAVLFNYDPSRQYADHVAMVTAVYQDGTIDAVSGDVGGTGSGSQFWSSSFVRQDHFRGAIGYSSFWSYDLSGYVSPRNLSAPAPAVVGVVAGRNADGRLEIFGRNSNGGVMTAYQTAVNGGWAGWTDLGGTNLVGGLAVAANADGRLEIFARNGNGGVMTTYQTAVNGGWAGWTDLGGTNLTGTPAAATNADGRLEIFVRNGNGGIMTTYQTAVNGGWAGWTDLGGLIV
jgi:hypothetical protein